MFKLPTIEVKPKEEEEEASPAVKQKKRLFQVPNYEAQELKVRLEKLRIQLEQKCNSVAGVQRNFQTVSGLLRDQKRQHQKLRLEFEQVSSLLLQSKVDLEAANKEKVGLQAAYKDLRDKAEKVVGELKEANGKHGKQKLETAQNEVKRLAQQRDKLANEISAKDAALQSSKERVKSSQQENFDLKQKLDQKLKENAELGDKCKDACQKLELKKKAFTLLEQKADNFERLLGEARREVKQKVESIGILTNRVMVLEQESASRLQRIDQMEERARLHDSEKEKLNSRIQELAGLVSLREQEIQKLEGTVREREETIARRDQQLVEQQNFYAGQKKEYLQMVERMRIIGKIQAEVNESLGACNHSIRILVKELELKSACIADLRAEAAAKERYFKECDQRIVVYRSFAASPERLKIAHQDDIFSVMKKYAELEEDYLKISEKYDRNNVTRSYLEQELERLRASNELQREERPQEHAFYKDRMHEKDLQIEGVHYSVSEVRWANERLQAEVAAHLKTIEALRFQISELRIQMIDYNKLKEDCTDLKAREIAYLSSIAESSVERAQLIRELDETKMRLLRKEDEASRLSVECNNWRLKAENLKRTVEELNVQNLMALKSQLDKKILICKDALMRGRMAVEALQKAVFQCQVCQQLVNDPVTALPCCHNYCRRCERGYEVTCLDCENGLAIDRTVSNPLLVKATPLFRHAKIVVEEMVQIFLAERPEKKTTVEKRIYFEKARPQEEEAKPQSTTQVSPGLKIPKKGKK